MSRSTRFVLFATSLTLLWLCGCMASWTEQMRFTQRTRWFPTDAASRERLAFVAFGESPEFRESPGVRERPTLIFVHGLGASKFYWKDFAALLAHQHGYATIVLDLLGHGDSDKPRDGDYRPSAQGERLARFIRGNPALLQERVVLIGMSYGAVSSLEAALLVRASGGPAARSLAGVFSISAPAFYYPSMLESPETLEYLTNPPALARLAAPWIAPELFEREILEAAMWRRERIGAAERAEVRRIYSDVRAREALFAATAGLVVELRARRDRFDHFALAPCPVFVLGGAQDRIVPNWVQQKLALSVGVSEQIIDQCGHAVAHDQPDAFMRALLSFLEGLGGARRSSMRSSPWPAILRNRDHQEPNLEPISSNVCRLLRTPAADADCVGADDRPTQG